MKNFLKAIKDTKGATAIEYGLIDAMIEVAAINAMRGLGQQLGSTFNTVSTDMANAKAPAPKAQ